MREATTAALAMAQAIDSRSFHGATGAAIAAQAMAREIGDGSDYPYAGEDGDDDRDDD